MMRTFLIWVIVLSATLAGCDQSPLVPQPPSEKSSFAPSSTDSRFEDPASKRTGSTPEQANSIIVAFGNSLTAGLGVASQENYPSLLQEMLKEKGYPYQVINMGVSGDTTAGGLRRLDRVLKLKPEIVILELGANDGLRGLPLDQTQENLSQMIRRLKAAKIRVILAGMKLPPNYGFPYAARFSSMYVKLAKEHGIVLIPFFLEGVAASQDLNQHDGIHPTAEGYRHVVENLWPVLFPLLVSGTDSKLVVT